MGGSLKLEELGDGDLVYRTDFIGSPLPQAIPKSCGLEAATQSLDTASDQKMRR